MKIDRRLTVVAVVALFLASVAVIGQSDRYSSTPQKNMSDMHGPPQPRGPEPKGLVPKFGIVWDGKLTRSGLPKDEDGWKWLRTQGVNSIVNFRARNNVDYKGYGFNNTLWIPLDNGRLPTAEEAEAYLAWIQDPTNQPVNIQCAEGKDRTGMMTALARYAIDGWPIDKALSEASLYRNGEPLADRRIKWLHDWAKKYPPGSHRRTQPS